MGSSLGNALFQTFGGGGADSVKNRLAGALAAGRMSTNKASARLNNSKADAQDTTNASHQAVLDMFGIDTDRGFAARQGNPQFKQTAEGVTEQYDLAQKKEGIAALLKSNPDIANQFRSGMSGADMRALGMMPGDKNLSAANVKTANAQTGSFNSLAGQRDAGAKQTNQQTTNNQLGLDAIQNNPDINSIVKALFNVVQGDASGSGLASIANIPGVAELLSQKANTQKSKQATEGSEQDVNKEKVAKIKQETKTEVEETKKVTEETKVLNKEIDLITAKIENWDAKTTAVEANMENFNAKIVAKIKEINSRTTLNDQKKLVMVETLKKVQAATQLFKDRSKALGGNNTAQNNFIKQAMALYKIAMDEDTPIGKDAEGNDIYISMLPLQEQLTKIAELFPKFKNHLFPEGTPSENAAQPPPQNPLAGAIKGQPSPTAAPAIQPGGGQKIGRFTVKARQ